jgi:peptidoglycan/xylan/chitin deacetylase (PgdA/CDA1 family)
MDLKHLIFRSGLSVLSMTGAARLMAAHTRGLGAVLMFHQVRPASAKGFQPHKALEITPAFLDAVLAHLTECGYEIIPIDDLAERIHNPIPGRPFAVLTFDDGYRDTAQYALPVLKRHAAPFTVFATTGFADGTAPLWWLDLAETIEMGSFASDAERTTAFRSLVARQLKNADLQSRTASLAAKAGIDTLARTRQLCLDRESLRALSAEPLCTIGAHSVTHPLLGTQMAEQAQQEMTQSKLMLEDMLQCAVRHFAYPVGDRVAAGSREFALARALGFETAVTTRPGVIYPEHAAHLHALPRLSINGLYQSIADFDVLLSGAAFRLFNGGRRLNVT